MKKIDSMLLRDVLRETFTNSEIPEFIDELKMGDFPEWDSLGNFNFLLAVEEKFGIHFDLDEIANLKSISDIKAVIEIK